MILRNIFSNTNNYFKTFLFQTNSFAFSTSSNPEYFLEHVPELKVGKYGDGQIDFESLGKKILLLYFSAGWCVKCKEFTPKLKKFYNTTKSDVAILWISRDKNLTDQGRYYNESLDSEWMYIPVGKPTREFMKIYKLGGLPSVKLVNNTDGNLIEEEAKGDIEANFEQPGILIEKWKKLCN